MLECHRRSTSQRMADSVRVRFAPSPTGDPHVGNIRTAVFNWLFARHHGGSFAIRIEDTDQAREVAGATEALLESLRWLGLDWDEGPDIGGQSGPYLQSQRLEGYRDAASRLLETGSAYYCYCSPKRLAELREKQARLKKDPGYDRRCRDMTTAEQIEWAKGRPTPAVRFKMPMEGSTTVDDLIRGRVTFENRLLDDFVVLKSDGFPTYHLANVVDDHAMKISHVMRAEEWLSSIPRHLQLYEALGLEPPRFAHLPMILAEDKSKLSKRHGAAALLEYRSSGFLPDAMVNFLALLGWSLDDKTEIMSREELVQHFSIERVAKAGAIFNQEKLLWVNGQYLRKMADKDLAEALLTYWRAYPPPEIPDLPERDYLLRIVPLISERIKTMSDAAPLVAFFFRDTLEYETEELVQKGMDRPSTKVALERALDVLSQTESFDAAATDAELRPLAATLSIKAGQLFGSIRVATTGLRVAPPLFESLEILGRDRSLASIKSAADRL